MAKLVPFNKKIQKQMGYVITKSGPMIDKSKLTDNKKFVKPEKKEVKELKKEIKNTPKPRLTVEEKSRLENRGVY